MKATPGRIVLFSPQKGDPIVIGTLDHLAAIVSAVHDDGTVNLSVLDAGGDWHKKQNVSLVDGNAKAGQAYWPNRDTSEQDNANKVAADKQASVDRQNAALVVKGVPQVGGLPPAALPVDPRLNPNAAVIQP